MQTMTCIVITLRVLVMRGLIAVLTRTAASETHQDDHADGRGRRAHRGIGAAHDV